MHGKTERMIWKALNDVKFFGKPVLIVSSSAERAAQIMARLRDACETHGMVASIDSSGRNVVVSPKP